MKLGPALPSHTISVSKSQGGAQTPRVSTVRSPSKEVLPSPTNLLDCPDELLVLVLSHISCPTKLAACLHSCKALHSLSSRHELYALWLYRHFQSHDLALFQAALMRSPPAEDVMLALLNLHGAAPSSQEQGARIAQVCATRGHDIALQCMLAAGHVDANARPTDEIMQQRWKLEPMSMMSCSSGGPALLHIASTAGSARVVECLLAAGADVHARAGSEGATALHMACSNGHTDCCAALLQVDGIELGCASSLETALHAAARRDHTGVVELLLLADPGLANVVDAQDSTALQLASGLGHAATVDLICALSGPELTMINHEDKFMQQTALVRACSQGHESVVEALIRQPGIELDKASSTAQETALHATCRSGHVRVLSLLLSTGQVDMDQLSASGESPLTLACGEGRIECVDVLLLAGASAQPLAMLRACAHGHRAVVRQLLSVEGMHLDFVDDKRATCLMLAAAGGHVALVEDLLNWGMVPAWVENAEVLAPTDLNGNTALHCAGGHGTAEVDLGGGGSKSWERAVEAMVAALIQRCGSAATHILQHAVNAAGETPLAVACRCGREPAARAMLQAVPECVNVPNTQTGCMPMSVASRAGHYELVRLLLQAGGIFQGATA